MQSWKSATLTVAAIALAGCAANPATIPPATVSAAPYKGLSCELLAVELRRAEEQRDGYIAAQKSARVWDGVLNVLVIPGLGAVTPDETDQVALWKGTVQAIQTEWDSRCVTQPVVSS